MLDKRYVKCYIKNNYRKDIMIYRKPFYITYYSNKDKKTITRRGKEDDKTRIDMNKAGDFYFVYYDLDANGYRTASKDWKVRY